MPPGGHPHTKQRYAQISSYLGLAGTTDEEKVEVCKAATLAKANFVKTSTGFGTGGAKVEDVKLMRESILDTMSVKASGGVRTLEDLEKMVAAGASRIGASSGAAIIKEYNDKNNK